MSQYFYVKGSKVLLIVSINNQHSIGKIEFEIMSVCLFKNLFISCFNSFNGNRVNRMGAFEKYNFTLPCCNSISLRYFH